MAAASSSGGAACSNEREDQNVLQCTFDGGETVSGVDPVSGWLQPWKWDTISYFEKWRLYQLLMGHLKKNPPPFVTP